MSPLHDINQQLIAQYGETTDKGTTYSSLDFYSKYMESKRSNVKLLEIGIGIGGSALLWSKYFDQFQIDMFDSAEGFSSPAPFQEQLLTTPNLILQFNKNSLEEQIATKFQDNYYDFIIDDSTNDLRNHWQNMLNFWPKLAVGGVYFMENILEPTAVEQIGIHFKLYFDHIKQNYEVENYLGNRIKDGNLNDVMIALRKL